jgi:hypothetical protein
MEPVYIHKSHTFIKIVFENSPAFSEVPLRIVFSSYDTGNRLFVTKSFIKLLNSFSFYRESWHPSIRTATYVIGTVPAWLGYKSFLLQFGRSDIILTICRYSPIDHRFLATCPPVKDKIAAPQTESDGFGRISPLHHCNTKIRRI